MEYTINTKIEKQVKNGEKPIICFFDIDGTIFTVSKKLLNAAIYNLQTKKILDQNNIPFVLVTGRSGWNYFYEIEMYLHGLPQPDAVITGAGTEIYFRTTYGKMEKDIKWSESLPRISYITSSSDLPFKRKNKSLLMSPIENITVEKLFRLVEDLENSCQKDRKIIYSESLIRKNTENIFYGNIFIVPRIAGKDRATEYVLKKIKENNLDVLIFGDASIDIPMINLKNTEKYQIKSFLVNPTPLALKESKKYPSIRIVNKEGPIAILEVLKKFKKNTPHNNKAREIIKTFEPILDSIFDKKLTANDISMMGLTKISQSLKDVDNGKKIKPIIDFILANLTDSFDGIRARQKGSNLNGQLVDVVCDRQKEFMQLKTRAEKRIKKNPFEAYHTYLSMISCILPSISRAQAEAKGIVVKERDEKGGSSLDRNGLLFKSFLYFLFNNNGLSYKIDKVIYERNILTFKNRINHEASSLNENLSIRKAAEERLSVLIYLLQKYNQYVENKLKSYKKIYNDYKLWKKDYIYDYVSKKIAYKTKNKDLLYLLSMPQ